LKNPRKNPRSPRKNPRPLDRVGKPQIWGENPRSGNAGNNYIYGNDDAGFTLYRNYSTGLRKAHSIDIL